MPGASVASSAESRLVVVVPKAKAPTEENAAESWAVVAAPGPTGVALRALLHRRSRACRRASRTP